MANPRKAPFRFWRFFFSLQGRVSRWPFLAVEIVTKLILLAGFQGIRHIPGLPPLMVGLYALPFALFNLIVLWPNFALLFKRFHDAGLTGLLALPYFAPFIYGGYAGYASVTALQHHDMAAMPHITPPYVGWILIGVNYGLVIIAVLLPAPKTVNRYGPRPGYLPDQAQDVF